MIHPSCSRVNDPFVRLAVGLVLICVACLAVNPMAMGQDLEPRRWTHLPDGAKFFGAGYAATDADIFFDPLLEIEDAEGDFQSAVVSYIQSFDLAGRSARFDVRIPYVKARWSGLLQGAPASTERQGFGDPRIRLSVNFLGSPALSGEEFRAYRASRPASTVAGAAISVTLPLGQYYDDRLLNIGQNRYIIRPQAGVVHTRGRWSFELTGSVFFYTDNDEFTGDRLREQDPLPAVQAHTIYALESGLWMSLSAGYGWDGESSVDGVSREDPKQDLLTAISFGLPVNRSTAVKLAYVRTRTGEDIGSDSDSIVLSLSRRF